MSDQRKHVESSYLEHLKRCCCCLLLHAGHHSSVRQTLSGRGVVYRKLDILFSPRAFAASSMSLWCSSCIFFDVAASNMSMSPTSAAEDVCTKTDSREQTTAVGGIGR